MSEQPTMVEQAQDVASKLAAGIVDSLSLGNKDEAKTGEVDNRLLDLE